MGSRRPSVVAPRPLRPQPGRALPARRVVHPIGYWRDVRVRRSRLRATLVLYDGRHPPAEAGARVGAVSAEARSLRRSAAASTQAGAAGPQAER